MTGMEAGWYRDPAPPNPAFPTTLRYWDGAGWTEQVKSAPKHEREAWHRDLAVARADRAAQAWEQAVATGRVDPEQVARVTAASRRFATPDGQPLSGWWRRVAATLIDGLITTTVGLAFGWPWLSEIGRAYGDFVQLVTEAARTGGPLPDAAAFTERIADPMLVLTLILWAVQFVYAVGFLKAFAATPGKMVLGLEVRLRERPGPLPWATVLVRWLTQNAGFLLRVVPMIPVLFSLYALLDVLWPLWDGKRQALHDKAARTNVVRRTA